MNTLTVKDVLVTVALTAAMTMATGAVDAEQTFKISAKGVLTWKQKIQCADARDCMVTMRQAKNTMVGARVAVTVGKKAKYVTINHKVQCDDTCINDIDTFIATHNWTNM